MEGAGTDYGVYYRDHLHGEREKESERERERYFSSIPPINNSSIIHLCRIGLSHSFVNYHEITYPNTVGVRGRAIYRVSEKSGTYFEVQYT